MEKDEKIIQFKVFNVKGYDAPHIMVLTDFGNLYTLAPYLQENGENKWKKVMPL